MVIYKDHPVFDEYDIVVGHDPGTVSGLSIFDRFGLRSAGVTVALGTKYSIEKRTIGLAYALMDQVYQDLEQQWYIDNHTSMVPKVLFVIENNYVQFGRAHTALTQREFIAVTAVYAHKQGYTVMRVSPKEAKKALTGRGDSRKPVMIRYAKDVCKATIDGLGSIAKREAVADSMGIAMAGMELYVNNTNKSSK